MRLFQTNLEEMKILILSVFLCFANVYSTSADGQNDLFHIPLRRIKSPYHLMLENNMDVTFLRRDGKVNPTKPPLPNDTVPLFKYLDSEFYGEVGVGHPAQIFKVIFDTAWASSWIPSITCSQWIIPGCMNHNRYDSTRSGSYQENNTYFKTQMEDGDIIGFLSTDNINLGHIKIRNQTFAEINQMPKSYFFWKADGVFGLAYQSLALLDVTPFFYNIINQKLIAKPIFSFYMNRDEGTSKGGSLFLGGSEPKHYHGAFTRVPVSKKEYWQFKMNKIQVEYRVNKSIVLCGSGCEAYADTSATAIEGPAQDIQIINRYIGAYLTPLGHRYEVSCRKINKLPEIVFFFGGRNFTLKGPDYTQKLSKGPVQICLSSFVEHLSSSPNQIWSLGVSFLSRFYVEFDMSKDVISFADANL